MIIRYVTPGDAAAVSLLSAQLGYTMTAGQTGTEIHRINNSISDIAFVAIDANNVIGWIHVFYTVRLECMPYCEIGGLVVDQEYRGKGIGKMFIAYIKQWCRERGCNTLKVRSNVKRTDAHRFYEQVGFEEIKQQKVFEIAL